MRRRTTRFASRWSAAAGAGPGAAVDALNVKNAPLKLVALADVFKDRLDIAHRALKRQFGERADVPEDRQFLGFDAYQKALDCLKPGDIAIFATPLAFRWVHFTYAIEKGLNVFMEKPLTADGPTSRKMLKLAEAAEAKNLKVGVGLMSRHSRAMQQLAERIHGGEIGDLMLLCADIGCTRRWPRCARRQSRPTCLKWNIRFAASTVSSGRAAAATAISTFI